MFACQALEPVNFFRRGYLSRRPTPLPLHRPSVRGSRPPQISPNSHTSTGWILLRAASASDTSSARRCRCACTNAFGSTNRYGKAGDPEHAVGGSAPLHAFDSNSPLNNAKLILVLSHILELLTNILIRLTCMPIT